MNKPMDVQKPVLEAILFSDKDCQVAFELLQPEHFTNKKYGAIFKVMKEMNQNGEPIDAITLYEKIGEEDLIIELNTGFSTANIKSHTNVLLDRWYLLKAHEKLMDAISWVEAPGRSVDGLRRKCEEISLLLADRVKDKGLVHISKIAQTAMEDLSKVEQGDFPGFQTGFRDLDDHGFFFRKKNLIVLAARPGMGKSALALKIALKAKVKTAVFSLEMSNEEQYERLISIYTGLTNNDLKDKSRLKEEQSKILKESVEINKNNIWINDSTRLTMATLASQCKRLQAQEGLDFVIVDYLGLVKTDTEFKQRNLAVSSISKGLKNLAYDLDVPVLALNQLNRDCESRNDKRPLLSDLRESGDIEQDAHMVIFLYREHIYDKEADKREAEVIFRKNRSGPTGTEKLTFLGESTDFVDYRKPMGLVSPSKTFGNRPKDYTDF